MSRRAKKQGQDDERPGIFVWLFRILVFGLAIFLCLGAALYFFYRLDGSPSGFSNSQAGSSSNLNPIEQVYLQAYLYWNRQALDFPLNFGPEPVKFEIEPGQTADQIGSDLVAEGIITDAQLFNRYVRYYGLDSQLEAGSFNINPEISISDLAGLLTDAQAEEVEVRFLEGWRYEEMVAYLRRVNVANVDADEFRLIVQQPGSLNLSEFEFLSALPPNSSLEGYLFPDTYRLPLDADASYLVRIMLENFDRKVSPSLRQSFGYHGLAVHEAVTLASIVQREAMVAEERPLMVGVFLNRLEQDILLQADPTVQYALGYQTESGNWWKSPLSTRDLEVDSPYNTYRYTGLPPAPISNPGLAALEAVADPIISHYLFFVVDCTSSIEGDHIFSQTFDEHLANVENCRE